jgi:hypothetical protein
MTTKKIILILDEKTTTAKNLKIRYQVEKEGLYRISCISENCHFGLSLKKKNRLENIFSLKRFYNHLFLPFVSTGNELLTTFGTNPNLDNALTFGKKNKEVLGIVKAQGLITGTILMSSITGLARIQLILEEIVENKEKEGGSNAR